MDKKFWELLAHALNAHVSIKIAFLGVFLDILSGMIYNANTGSEWACDIYFLGDAVSAMLYGLALYKYRKCVLFSFIFALYGAEVYDELLGDPFYNGWDQYIVVLIVFLEAQFNWSSRFIKYLKSKV